MLESNHDREMVLQGPYPTYLKHRILSGRGHLSNGDCAQFLPELARSGTRRFLLAHVSRENNTPALARETALDALTEAGLEEGVDFWLGVAGPENQEGTSILF